MQPYRCMSCRARNMLARQLRDYKRVPKCKHCNSKSYTSRGLEPRYYVDRERLNRKPCTCEGAYHWAPRGQHRKGSPMCMHNPNWITNRKARDGADMTDEEVDRYMGELLSL